MAVSSTQGQYVLQFPIKRDGGSEPGAANQLCKIWDNDVRDCCR